jgi:hypothetical protein
MLRARVDFDFNMGHLRVINQFTSISVRHQIVLTYCCDDGNATTLPHKQVHIHSAPEKQTPATTAVSLAVSTIHC